MSYYDWLRRIEKLEPQVDRIGTGLENLERFCDGLMSRVLNLESIYPRHLVERLERLEKILGRSDCYLNVQTCEVKQPEERGFDNLGQVCIDLNQRLQKLEAPDPMSRSNSEVRKELEEVKHKNWQACTKINALEKENASLKETNVRLDTEVKSLQQRNENQSDMILRMQDQVKKIKILLQHL